MAATFFEAESPFGALSGWTPQQAGGKDKTKTRASVLGADGDESAHVDHDNRETVSATYASTGSGQTLTIPAFGAVLNGYMVDSVNVTYAAQDVPQMTVAGHKHLDTATGASGHSGMRTYAGTVTLPNVALGVPDAIGPLSTTGARSASYSLSGTHIDEFGGQGKHVAADNHDGVETVTMESIEAITVTDSGNDWTVESDSDSKSNNAATANTVTATKHIAHVTSSS